jgi:hypothetical protein
MAFGKDLTLKDDAGNHYSYDNIRGASYAWGKSAGAEETAVFLIEKAVNLFRSGKDAEAIHLRDVALEIRTTFVEKLRQQAGAHEKQYPESLTESAEE